MEHKITDQLHYGVYLATPEFQAISQHSCVCYEDMTLVAVTGRAEDELSQKYAELFASAPALVDAVAALAAENAKLREALESISERATEELGEWDGVEYAHLPINMNGFWYIQHYADEALKGGAE